MTYFCAKCQRRHPIEDISADMWGICKDDLRGTLQEVLGEYKQERTASMGFDNEAIEDLEDELIRFINNTDPVSIDCPEYHGTGRVNAYFPLNRRNASQLEHCSEARNMVSGTFSIRLGALLDACLACTTDKHKKDQILSEKEKLTDAVLSKNLCSKDVVMLLNRNGVLDRVTDKNNEPFPVGKKMLGFTKICPHCGGILSRAAGCAEEIVVALAGSPRAGKSSSMVAMISSLRSGANPYIHIIPTPHDEYWEALESEINSYRSCKKITKTVAELTDVPFYSILIQIGDAQKTERVLTVVDMAGEFWTGEDGLLSPEFFAGYSRLYENLDCIWFVTSKATVRLSGVYSAPDPEVIEELAKATSEEYEMIQRSNPTTLMANLGLLKSQLDARIGKAMPPTIVIVTKPDFCVSGTDVQETRSYRLFPVGDNHVNQYNSQDLGSLFCAQSNTLCGVNGRNLYASGQLVRNFIRDKNAGLIAAVENNCDKCFYAVLSAYGRPAFDAADGRSSEPCPFHELFPLVWTLAITGALPVVHEVHWTRKSFLGSVVSEQDTREIVRCDFRQAANSNVRKTVPDEAVMRSDILRNLLMQTTRYAVTFIDHERK